MRGRADGLLSLTLVPSAIYKASSFSLLTWNDRRYSAHHTLWSVGETTVGETEEPRTPLRRWD
jgi:hypothetical protein